MLIEIKINSVYQRIRDCCLDRNQRQCQIDKLKHLVLLNKYNRQLTTPNKDQDILTLIQNQ